MNTQEIISMNEAKKKMKELDVIIYGSIRDIEKYFFQSFINIDIISSYFRETLIIIFENDSKDNTREQLISWSKISKPKIKKYIILKNDLDKIYPLRAHRLAYCRNCILNYIFDNNLHKSYIYAIHCDLDERFWGVGFETLANCFQYDCRLWDAMTCVNKNKTYYDFWALRCDKSWFNINIFSCAANGIDYNTKIESFETLLKNTNGLISTTSSFNGLGIYKLNSIVYCRYNADYKCSTCNKVNRGCWEDNDHIGLHKQMINNNCKLFINNKMYIQTQPEHCENYYEFILKLKYIRNIQKNVLMYMLMSNLINKDGKWILVNINDGEVANKITNYYENNLYAINNSNINYDTLLNKNIKVINTEDYSNLFNEMKISHHCQEYLSFIYINCNTYQTTKNLLDNIYTKIKNTCIIIFDILINYPDYAVGALKAFYEFTVEYNIGYEWLFINGQFIEHIDENNLLNYDDKSIAVKIIKNNHFNNIITNIDYFSKEYETFNWIFYTNHYPDLVQSKTKEDAYLHWKNYGIFEGRICTPEIDNLLKEDNTDMGDFDWEIYLEINTDLKECGIKTKDEAYRHWKTCGINEKRIYKIDWCRYIKDYNLMTKGIDTKIKAIQYWRENGRPDLNSSIKNYENELFDWKFYVNKYEDLKHINNEQLAMYHWDNYGKSEGRISNNFNWTNYLLVNPDLVKLGINIESTAIYHWLKHGKRENRKISL